MPPELKRYASLGAVLAIFALGAIGLDAARSVHEAQVAAVAVGHTSGADGTLGLLAGIAAWGPENPVMAAERLIRPSIVPVS